MGGGWRINDELASSLIAETGIELQAWRPALLLINGNNRGIYRIREKINEHYLSSHFKIDPNKVNIVKGGGAGTAVEGSNTDYKSMIDFVNNNDIRISRYFDTLKTLMDIENHTAYYASEIFFANTDWPNNNIKYWNVPGEQKWRWIFFDLDFAFQTSKITENMMTWLTSTRKDLFSKLIINQEYKSLFIATMCDFLNTYFIKERADSITVASFNSIEPGLNYQWASYYNFRFDNSYYVAFQDQVNQFMEDRPEHVLNHIWNHFDLGDTTHLHINTTTGGKVKLTSHAFVTGEWTGKYFENIPLTLTAIPDSGYQFIGWDEDIYSADAQISVPMDKETYLQAHFEKIEAPVKTPKENINLDIKIINNQLTFSVKNAEQFTWTLTNSSGKILFKGKKHSISNDYTVNLPKKHKGVLILHVQQGSQQLTRKITRL